MSEGELLSLAVERESLTDVARQILTEELAFRGLNEAQIEEWKHPLAPGQSQQRISHWERRRKQWKRKIWRFYDRFPVSPFWLIGMLFLASVRYFFKWGKNAPELAGLVFFGLAVTLLIIVILLPVQRGK